MKKALFDTLDGKNTLLIILGGGRYIKCHEKQIEVRLIISMTMKVMNEF